MEVTIEETAAVAGGVLAVAIAKTAAKVYTARLAAAAVFVVASVVLAAIFLLHML